MATTSFWKARTRLGTNHLQFRSLTTSPQRYASAVRIMEVGPRDGLQNIKQTIATPVKLELINRLAETGLCAIEATSFVPPKWIPQLADSADVMSQIMPMVQKGAINFPVLTPNIKGLERAAQAGAKDVVVFASASEGFSKANQNSTIEVALAKQREVADAALKLNMRVRGVISCIYSCPFDGPTPLSKVLKVAKEFLDMGCYEVGLGDTLGVGTPKDTQKLLEVLLKEIPADKLAGHFHDTYGQAVANVIRAYDMGLRTFDSSVAGLGGCPYAKGAKGNLATEDIVYMFEQSGVDTGVDLDKLVSTGEWISRQLGQPNGSRAGSALFSKIQSKLEAAESSTESASIPQASASSPRNWKEIEDTGEYKASRAGNVVKITLTRPRNGNAMTGSMVNGLTRLYQNLAKDPTVFHIVLAAEGKFFCTGMDLKSTDSSDESTKSSDFNKLNEFFSAIQNAPQTTIAVIDGPTFAGGIGLAFSNDVRLVSSQARFTLTEIKLGLSPAIISKFLIREWGISFFREAMLSGREIAPDELKNIGAVHGIGEDTKALNRMTEEYLEKLAKCAPQSAANCKELVRLGWADPDGPKQNKRIKETFDKMMLPGSEGKFGIEQFAKKIRGIDWGQFWASRGAKL